MFSRRFQDENHWNEKPKIYDTRFILPCNRNDNHVVGMAISVAVMQAGGKSFIGDPLPRKSHSTYGAEEGDEFLYLTYHPQGGLGMDKL